MKTSILHGFQKIIENEIKPFKWLVAKTIVTT